MRRNHALWLGPLVALLGLVSYFALFARWPLTRDVPWVNLLLLALGLVLSVVALRRARGAGLLVRGAAYAGLAASSFFAAVLLWYCYSWSYGLPDASGALAAGEPVPALRLLDQEGRETDLGRGDAGTVVLVFYRGFW